MAQQPTTRNHDFESQLELAEMMLNLGRIDEAAVELKKAKDLNEIGAHRHPVDSMEHEANLRRLANALERVEEMQGRQNRTGRVWAIAASIALLGLTGLMFVTWALNRNEMLEMRAGATEDFQIVFAERTAEAEQVRLAVGEQTRQAQQITDLYQENSLYRYQATQNALAISAAIEQSGISAATQIAAEATRGAERFESVTPIPPPSQETDEEATTEETDVPDVVITTDPVATLLLPTPLSGESLANSIDQIRVDAPFTANMRRGPGFEYNVIGVLRRGEVVTVQAKSGDGYWYDILTEDGAKGWLHTSLAKPVSLDWLPTNTNVPLPPRPTATPTSEPTETPPNPTPPPAPTLTPSPIPPTAVPPTDIPPTAVPPTDVPPTDIPPTAVPPTDVPPTAVPPTDVPPTDIPATDVPPTTVAPPTVEPTPLPGLTTATSEPAPTVTATPEMTETPTLVPNETSVAPSATPDPEATETPTIEPTPEPSPTDDGGSVDDFIATITPVNP